jgi:uncharacterized membrane protein YgcG
LKRVTASPTLRSNVFSRSKTYLIHLRPALAATRRIEVSSQGAALLVTVFIAIFFFLVLAYSLQGIFAKRDRTRYAPQDGQSGGDNTPFLDRSASSSGGGFSDGGSCDGGGSDGGGGE